MGHHPVSDQLVRPGKVPVVLDYTPVDPVVCCLQSKKTTGINKVYYNPVPGFRRKKPDYKLWILINIFILHHITPDNPQYPPANMAMENPLMVVPLKTTGLARRVAPCWMSGASGSPFTRICFKSLGSEPASTCRFSIFSEPNALLSD